MAEELQSLLEKINAEGVKKAESERDAIISAAKAEADAIIKAARAEAAAERKSAADEAAALKARAESAVSQSARDILLALDNELKERINQAVAGAAAQALSAEFMAGLIKDLAAKFAADPDAGITVLCAARDAEVLEKALCGALAASFKTVPKVLASAGISGGMEVSFRDGELFFDFTLDAVTDLVADYSGELIGRLIRRK